MNPRLRVETGRQINYEYEIPPVEEAEAVWLGRGPFCQIRIQDRQVSRRHLQFAFQDGHLYVEDLGSTTGTFVNGKRIEGRIELRDGDEVSVPAAVQPVVMRVIYPVAADAPEGALAKLGAGEEDEEALEKLNALSGQTLAGYELGKVIYSGASSVVFHAKDPEGGRPVAVKVLKPISSVTVEDQNRFIRGAKHAATLRHPGFVRVLKGGRVDDWYFVAMEYVRGKNLESVIEAKGTPLEVATAMRIIRQVLEALQHACEKELVFRAVRPDNVIVCEGLRVKLTDFDLVKPLSGRREAQVTRVMDGSLQVDPRFAAPELIAYPVVADTKADIFGCGATLYYMLCARAPFGNMLPADKLSSAFDRTFENVRQINPAVPQAVCDVIARAMSDYERYNTPKDMLDALEGALGAGSE